MNDTSMEDLNGTMLEELSSVEWPDFMADSDEWAPTVGGHFILDFAGPDYGLKWKRGRLTTCIGSVRIKSIV